MQEINFHLTKLLEYCQSQLNLVKTNQVDVAVLPVPQPSLVHLEKYCATLGNLFIKLLLTVNAKSRESIKVINEINKTIRYIEQSILPHFVNAGPLVWHEFKVFYSSFLSDMINVCSSLSSSTSSSSCSSLDNNQQVGSIVKAQEDVLKFCLSSHQVTVKTVNDQMRIFNDAILELKQYIDDDLMMMREELIQEKNDHETTNSGEEEEENDKTNDMTLMSLEELIQEVTALHKATQRAKLILQKIQKTVMSLQPEQMDYQLSTLIMNELVNGMKLFTRLTDDVVVDVISEEILTEETKMEFIETLKKLSEYGKRLVSLQCHDREKSMEWFELMMKHLVI